MHAGFKNTNDGLRHDKHRGSGRGNSSKQQPKIQVLDKRITSLLTTTEVNPLKAMVTTAHENKLRQAIPSEKTNTLHKNHHLRTVSSISYWGGGLIVSSLCVSTVTVQIH